MTKHRLHTNPTSIAMRRQAFLVRVTDAKAALMQAEEELRRATEAAKYGGCSLEEIAAAVRLIERAARA